MPLHAYIAGSPNDVAALAEYLEQTFKSACDELADTYVTRRKTAEYAWDGLAGHSAANQIGSLVKATDVLTKVSKNVGAAIDAYANSLRKAQNHIAKAREVAAVAGLPVNDTTIQGPPRAPNPSWEVPSEISGELPSEFSVPPAQEPVFQAWQAQVAAWNNCVSEVDRAYEILEEAGVSLVNDLGIATNSTESASIPLEAMVTPAAQSPSEVFLPGIEARFNKAAQRAADLAEMSPDRSQQLYEHPFDQLDSVAEADKTRRQAKIAELGGPATDVAMTSYELIMRTGKGQSLKQAIAAEAAGLTLGSAFSAAGGGGTRFVLTSRGFGGPWVSAAVFGVGAAFGLGGAVLGSDAVDQWYKERDLGKLIRNARLENRQVQRSDVGTVEERY